MRREGELCAKCREAGYSPEDVSEEYRELFRAARMLFEEGVTDENVIIPALASWRTCIEGASGAIPVQTALPRSLRLEHGKTGVAS